jgi:quercetin dioxygenase-like cupin family protein
MKVILVEAGETYSPIPGWKRVSLAGSEQVSVEYFEKPAGHSSPMHTHPNQQVTVILTGHMKVITGAGEEALVGPGDSAWFPANEPHRIENPTQELAIGVDIFTPARDFSFWKEKRG